MGMYSYLDISWQYEFDKNSSGIQNKIILEESKALNIFFSNFWVDIVEKVLLELNNYYKLTIDRDANIKQSIRLLEAEESMCFLGIVLLMSRVIK